MMMLTMMTTMMTKAQFHVSMNPAVRYPGIRSNCLQKNEHISLIQTLFNHKIQILLQEGGFF